MLFAFIVIFIIIFYIVINVLLKINNVPFVVAFYLFLIIFALIWGPLENIGYWELSNPLEYARITALDFKATLHDSEEEGNYLSVKEVLNFDIRAFSKNNRYLELWRGLEEYRADGLTTYFKIKSVKQIMPNGEIIEYEQSPELYIENSDYTNSELGPQKWFHSKGPYSPAKNQYECLMIYPGSVHSDNLKFEIEYDIHDCTYKYKDCSEIYYQIFNGQETKYIKSFNFDFLIPYDLMPKKRKLLLQI